MRNRHAAFGALMLVLLLLGGAATPALHAQAGGDPNYVLWIEPDVDSCTAGEVVRFRVFLEIKPGAAPLVEWQFGACHDPELLKLADLQPGASLAGLCNGQNPAQVILTPVASRFGTGFTEVVTLAFPGGPPCELREGCPYELAVATYECTTDIPDLVGRVCPCDGLGVDVPVDIQLITDDGRTIRPTLRCDRYECEGQTRPCDTHCLGLDVIVQGTTVQVSASAVDDSNDPILYTFTAIKDGNSIVIGPQASNTATFTNLTPGVWIIVVTVGDGSGCEPPANDFTCRTTVDIIDQPPDETCDCSGTDFWLAFPGNYAPDPNMPKELLIQVASDSPVAATVDIEAPALGIAQTVIVPPAAVKQVVMPFELELGWDSDVITPNGIHVSSDAAVQVHGLNMVQFTVDGFLALPTTLLGTDYLVLGYENVHVAPRPINGSQLAIVATDEKTQVVITPTADTDGHPAGAPFALVLEKGETYQLTNLDPFRDLTGTEVRSDKPIAVFGSHRCATIPASNELFCNYNVEQLPPTDKWGQGFLTLPLKTRAGGDIFRFLAQTDGTSVFVNSVNVAVLNRGEFHEMKIAVPAAITSSFPILVGQYSQGSWVDNVDDSDPSMMLVTPVTHYRNRYLYETPQTFFDSRNFFHVIVPGGMVGAVLLDGVPIPAAAFVPVHTTGYQGAAVQITKGTPHTVTGPGPFGVAVYGYDQFDAYSFPVCFSLGRRGTVGGQEQCEPIDPPNDPPPVPIELELEFIRGDANQTGAVDISDGIAILLGLFAGGPLDCHIAADVNSSANVDLSDAVTVFRFLFLNGPAPAAPYPACGPGTVQDAVSLTCEAFTPCASTDG